MKQNNIQIKFIEHSIALITIQRKPINALSTKFLKSLNEVFADLEKNKDVRVIILESSLQNFSAGADLKERSIMNKKESSFALDAFKNCFYSIENSSKITICCINGYCLGGGAELSLCFDFRIASYDSLVGFPETSIGIIPGAGGTQRLPKIIGLTNAKYWIYTANKFSAKECLEAEFVSEITNRNNLVKSAIILSKKIIKNSPIGVRCSKKAIDEGYNLQINDSLIVERTNYNIAVNTEDRNEALKAFNEKREPKWKNK